MDEVRACGPGMRQLCGWPATQPTTHPCIPFRLSAAHRVQHAALGHAPAAGCRGRRRIQLRRPGPSTGDDCHRAGAIADSSTALVVLLRVGGSALRPPGCLCGSLPTREKMRVTCRLLTLVEQASVPAPAPPRTSSPEALEGSGGSGSGTVPPGSEDSGELRRAELPPLRAFTFLRCASQGCAFPCAFPLRMRMWNSVRHKMCACGLSPSTGGLPRPSQPTWEPWACAPTAAAAPIPIRRGAPAGLSVQPHAHDAGCPTRSLSATTRPPGTVCAPYCPRDRITHPHSQRPVHCPPPLPGCPTR